MRIKFSSFNYQFSSNFQLINFRRKEALLHLKIVTYLILVTCYLIITVPAYADGATLTLSPATGTFNKGCSFSTDVMVDTGGADTDGTDAIVFYDATRLNATSITPGTIYSDSPGNSIDPQSGKITISGLASATQTFRGSGKLATINFTVLDTAPTGLTQLKFDFDPADKTKTSDSNVIERGTVSDVLSQVVNASYTIGTGTCANGTNPSPSPTLKPIGGPSGTSTPSATLAPTPSPVPKKLPPAGDNVSFLMFGIVGGTLTLLGALGIMFL